MLEPLSRAVAQLDDPVFRGAVWRSAAWSALAFVLLAAGLSSGLVRLVPAEWSGSWWLGWLAWLAGGAGAGVLAMWLFVPLAMLIASLFLESIAAAVDRRWYRLPPPTGAAPAAAQLWDGVVLGVQVLLLQVLALVLTLLLPGVGLVLGFLVAGWGIGRGLFVGVAMRRMGRRAAQGAYAHVRLPVLVQGTLLALAGAVPGVNLLIPVLGTAAMVHVLNRRLA